MIFWRNVLPPSSRSKSKSSKKPASSRWQEEALLKCKGAERKQYIYIYILLLLPD
jgi:hypothetical protein